MTTDPELPIDLSELERLEKAATMGPWIVETIESDSCDGYITGRILADAHDYMGPSVCEKDTMTREDSEFIAALRNACPRLLALIRAQRREIERLRTHSPACVCVACEDHRKMIAESMPKDPHAPR